MIIQKSGKLEKLEALRGMVAFYVLLGHTFSGQFRFGNHDLSFLLNFGQEAVILFFVLSGFVIQYSFQKSADKSFKLYFFKRFLRIYIPLLLVFVVNYLLVCYQDGGFFRPDWLILAGNVLMLQDASALKSNVICGSFLGNSPLWSLSYEWWFYMIFFFVATRYRNQASTVIYVLGILAAVSYLFYPNFVNRIIMYMVIWWVGADMAMLYLYGKGIDFGTMSKPLVVLIAVTGVLGLNVVLNSARLAQDLGYSSIGISPYLELRHFSFSIVAIVGALIWARFKWVLFDKTIGLFEPFAKISFGVYISHWFLVAKANYLDGVIGNIYIRYVMYFGICFLFAFLVERKIYPYISKKILGKLKSDPQRQKELVREFA